MSRVGIVSREGDWIQTYSGGQFWPLDPRVEEIKLLDIAAGLARDCRYGGQCKFFYSVAEHSVLMARAGIDLGFDGRALRAALFHDASEGLGLRDIPRPVKRSLGNYKAIETAIMQKVAEKFGFDWPMPARVKLLDERIGLAEELQNMGPKPAAWRAQEPESRYDATEPLPVTLQCWQPEKAFSEFLDMAERLGVRP